MRVLSAGFVVFAVGIWGYGFEGLMFCDFGLGLGDF